MRSWTSRFESIFVEIQEYKYLKSMKTKDLLSSLEAHWLMEIKRDAEKKHNKNCRLKYCKRKELKTISRRKENEVSGIQAGTMWNYFHHATDVEHEAPTTASKRYTRINTNETDWVMQVDGAEKW